MATRARNQGQIREKVQLIVDRAAALVLTDISTTDNRAFHKLVRNSLKPFFGELNLVQSPYYSTIVLFWLSAGQGLFPRSSKEARTEIQVWSPAINGFRKPSYGWCTDSNLCQISSLTRTRVWVIREALVKEYVL